MKWEIGQMLSIGGRVAEVYYIEEHPDLVKIGIEYKDDLTTEVFVTKKEG